MVLAQNLVGHHSYWHPFRFITIYINSLLTVVGPVSNEITEFIPIYHALATIREVLGAAFCRKLYKNLGKLHHHNLLRRSS